MMNIVSIGYAQNQETKDSQEAQADLTIERIIVTAQRKEQSIQNTPVAISALGPDDIEKMQIDNAKDLSQVMPNVLIKPVKGGSAGITASISGGSVSDGANLTSEAEVGVYIDDVYQPRSAEALKIISRIPDEMFRLKNEVSIGRWNEIYDKFTASEPLSDDQKLRSGISGLVRERDGGRQYNATQDKEVGVEDYKGFQTDLYYEGDTFTARCKNFFTDYTSDGTYASAVDPFQLDNPYHELSFTSGEIDKVLSPF